MFYYYMCWPWPKKYEKIRTPIITKFKRCYNCKRKFGLKYRDYVKIKKQKNYQYYCSRECYIKKFDESKELFDIDLNI